MSAAPLPRVRSMTTDDLSAVLAIERRVQPSPWSEAVFRAEIGREDRCYLVAEADGRVAGYAGMIRIVDEAHVANVAVAPELQGRGIGATLVLALHREAVRLGLGALTLEVRAGNDRAKALYRRFGYAPVGVRKGYYADNGEDALVLWVHDIGGAQHQERLGAIAAALGADPPVAAASRGVSTGGDGLVVGGTA
jgi:[ribosomal protein S18]-alanine N-acetyltransferase